MFMKQDSGNNCDSVYSRTNLQVVLQFDVASHDVFSLLVLYLGLLQTVLQNVQVLDLHRQQNTTTHVTICMRV